MKGKLKRKEENRTSIILDVEMRQTKAKVIQAVLGVFFIFISMIFILPVFWMLLSSFKGTREFMQVPPSLLPEEIDLSKLARVWKRQDLGASYLATLVMIVGDVAFSLFCCGLGGYVLSRLKPAGSKAVMMVVLWSMMMPGNLSMVPLFINLTNGLFGINMMDSYLPLWIMHGGNAFNTLLFKSFFDGISTSYLEVARIDGGTELGIFAKIIMPLSRPVFMSVAIFTVVGGWGTFLWPSLLIKTKYKMPIGQTILSSKTSMPVDEYLMLLTFGLVPPMLFFCFFQKYIMDGISLGGIKG